MKRTMDVSDYHDLLMTDPWFQALPSELIRLILENSTIRDVADGTFIFAAEDQPTGQFAILEGEVRLCLNTRNGKHVIFPIFRAGAWFGHLSVLDGQPRFQDAIASGPTRLLFFSKAAFNRIINDDPRYALDFAKLVCRHIRVTMSLLAEAQTASLRGRLAHTLLNLAVNPAQKQRISQEALAAMMGASRQTINRILKRWEQDNLVAVHYGQVLVCDRVALSRLVDSEDLIGDGGS